MVHISDGLFIYAATVCRFVATEECPERALGMILNDRNTVEGRCTDSTKMEPLYEMYEKIVLKAITLKYQTGLQKILGTIATLCQSLHPKALARLLGLHEHDIYFHLQKLHSVV
jgi:hypothetical protein